MLFQLHVGDAVHQQTTNPVGSFEDRDFMPNAVQLSRRSQPGGSRTDNRDTFSGPSLRRIGLDPTLFESMVDDRTFDVLDRDRRISNSQDARTLARGGANPSGELRKIVRLVQTIECLAPVTAIDQIVPFGNQVIDGTSRRHSRHQRTGVTERNSTIHASRTLRPQFFFGHVLVKFIPIENPQSRIKFAGGLALKLFKTGRLAHVNTKDEETRN